MDLSDVITDTANYFLEIPKPITKAVIENAEVKSFTHEYKCVFLASVIFIIFCFIPFEQIISNYIVAIAAKVILFAVILIVITSTEWYKSL